MLAMKVKFWTLGMKCTNVVEKALGPPSPKVTSGLAVAKCLTLFCSGNLKENALKNETF